MTQRRRGIPFGPSAFAKGGDAHESRRIEKAPDASAAFHGWLSLNKQKKIPKILKLMQFPCSDALSYSHLAEGRVDIVIQCSNKIWDIHPLIPIIKAAGGIISTWDNRDAANAGNILVSSNKKIHNNFLKLLKPVSK